MTSLANRTGAGRLWRIINVTFTLAGFVLLIIAVGLLTDRSGQPDPFEAWLLLAVAICCFGSSLNLLLRNWIRTVGVVLATCAGVWLVADSLTFALAPFDGATGRARGCYTFTENVLHFTEPSDGVRLGQGVLGLLLGFGAAPTFLFLRHNGRREHS